MGDSSSEDWRGLAAAELRGADPDSLVWHTPEGIDVKPLYTAADLEGLETVGGLPGMEPFVRGPGRRCTRTGRGRSASTPGFSTAEESNAFYRQNLAAGQMGLSVAFDLATHRGYDSDHPRVVGDVGKAGVAIDSVEDMKLLFDGIPLDKMSVSMTMNGAVLPVLAGYVVAGEEQGVLAGPAQRDDPERHPQRVHGPQHLHLPARAEHADRRRHHPVHRAAHAAVQLDLDLRLPHARGGRDRGAGARLHARRRARIRAHGRRARARVDEFAGRLSFFFAIGMNFFMEVAKLRAARLLWSRIMTDLGAQKAGSKMLRTHCQTSGVPPPNAARTSPEAVEIGRRLPGICAALAEAGSGPSRCRPMR